MNCKILIIFKPECRPLARAMVLGLLLGLSACTVAPTLDQPPQGIAATSDAPLTKPTTPVLSVEADSALKTAERNVLEAKMQRALWIAAVDELDKARAAAKVFDSASTLRHAHEASALCALSLQQKQAPAVTW